MTTEDGIAQASHGPQIDEESAFFLEMIAVNVAKHVLVMRIFWHLSGVLFQEEITEEEIVTKRNGLDSVSDGRLVGRM